jgi:ABC-type phosphate transport system auxiliary subunit
MANNDNSKKEVDSEVTFNELVQAYEDLYNKARMIKKENKVLHDSYRTLEIEKSSLEIELDMSKETNNQLHEKIVELEDIYEHFEDTLNNLKTITRLNTEFCNNLKAKFNNKKNTQNKSHAPRHAWIYQKDKNPKNYRSNTKVSINIRI